MTLNYLKEVCRARNADLGSTRGDDIQEIYDFAAGEIEAGESEATQVEMALEALDEIQ